MQQLALDQRSGVAQLSQRCQVGQVGTQEGLLRLVQRQILDLPLPIPVANQFERLTGARQDPLGVPLNRLLRNRPPVRLV